MTDVSRSSDATLNLDVGLSVNGSPTVFSFVEFMQEMINFSNSRGFDLAGNASLTINGVTVPIWTGEATATTDETPSVPLADAVVPEQVKRAGRRRRQLSPEQIAARSRGGKIGGGKNRARAEQHARTLGPIIQKMRSENRSTSEIEAELRRLGHRTVRGHYIGYQQIAGIMSRYRSLVQQDQRQTEDA